MTENEQHLNQILKALNDTNILDNLILIGSWSLLFYRKTFLNFIPSIRTTDLDFYVPDVKKVKETNKVINSLKELNYDVVYDVLSSKTRFISPDGFELEFLTKQSRNNLHCIKVGNTGIFAEALPYVDIFTGNFIEVDFDGLMVKVASPTSFILQKLLINSERKEKAEKDMRSIKEVLTFVKASRKMTGELKELYDSLPKSWKKKINKALLDNEIVLFE